MNSMLITGSRPPIELAIEALNAAFQADSEAIWTLMNAYVRCNEALANHPTVEVLEKETRDGAKLQVGMMGLLYGVLEAAIGAKVCLLTSEPNEKGQRTLLGFDAYKVPSETPEKKPSLIV